MIISGLYRDKLWQSYFNRLESLSPDWGSYPTSLGSTTTDKLRNIRSITYKLFKELDNIGLSKYIAIYPLIGYTLPTAALNVLSETNYNIVWHGNVYCINSGLCTDGYTGYGVLGMSNDFFPGQADYPHIASSAWITQATTPYFSAPQLGGVWSCGFNNGSNQGYEWSYGITGVYNGPHHAYMGAFFRNTWTLPYIDYGNTYPADALGYYGMSFDDVNYRVLGTGIDVTGTSSKGNIVANTELDLFANSRRYDVPDNPGFDYCSGSCGWFAMSSLSRDDLTAEKHITDQFIADMGRLVT